jgi:acylphosphatase
MSGAGTAGDERSRCRRFRVTGCVQGVFFRDSTRRVALDLGLTGYAKNMPDGSVEVLACGGAEALDRLAEWLRSGPPMASVTGVEAADADVASPEGFAAR